ncbi:VOC family protein [Lampropedia puyangensis]|uniref:VOC family protein n=1 Tax=Lampropedia puyangensis TaxID=1330072 RepID=A0A4S8F1I7_9BURK|nr:VOC family protein [Lampropedia puyangensis]THU00205.1 VOC family protein [Lampropedia puyangensis]
MEQDQYWNPLVPELTVCNLEDSLRFYVAVGFSIRFRRKQPAFAYLELGQAQLMLEQEHTQSWNVAPLDRPLGRGVNFQIEVTNANKVQVALELLGVPLFRPMKDTWYPVSQTQQEGQRELLAQDPDGYLMRFAQYLGRRSAT